MELTNIVKNIGLAAKEARLYLAALELGSSRVAEIARRARVNRVTAYDLLAKLMKKGLVNSLMRGGTAYFDATDPHTVASELKRKALDFKNALPAFRRLAGLAVHPRIRYFEGLEGIKAIYEETLASKTEILNYSNSREIRLRWPDYDEEYVAARIKKKIFLRGISVADEYGKRVQKDDPKSFREIRLVPSGEFTFTNEINIYDDKVAIVSFKDEPLIGMVIESPEIANTQRDIFKMAWEFSGPIYLNCRATGRALITPAPPVG